MGEGCKQRGVRRSSGPPQMKNLIDCGGDRAKQGIIGDTMGDSFTRNAILLDGEVEKDHGGSCKLVQGSGGSIVTASGRLDGDIL